jgi:hypothetical protein
MKQVNSYYCCVTYPRQKNPTSKRQTNGVSANLYLPLYTSKTEAACTSPRARQAPTDEAREDKTENIRTSTEAHDLTSDKDRPMCIKREN